MGLVFLGIYIAFVVFVYLPWYEEYTAFWEEYRFGARSPYGPLMFHIAWMLALVLLITFFAIWSQMKNLYLSRIQRKQRKLVVKGVHPMNVFLEMEALRKYSVICPKCDAIVVTYPRPMHLVCYECNERIMPGSVRM